MSQLVVWALSRHQNASTTPVQADVANHWGVYVAPWCLLRDVGRTLDLAGRDGWRRRAADAPKWRLPSVCGRGVDAARGASGAGGTERASRPPGLNALLGVDA